MIKGVVNKWSDFVVDKRWHVLARNGVKSFYATYSLLNKTE